MDCTFLRLEGLPPPGEIPEGTSILDLSHNLIREVPTDAFAALPNLRILRLDHNRINTLHQHAFR